MNVSDIRTRFDLDTEIPVTKEDAELLFGNPAFMEFIRLTIQATNAAYYKIARPELPSLDTQYLRGMLAALHTAINFEASILHSAAIDARNNTAPKGKDALKAFQEALLNMIGDDYV